MFSILKCFQQTWIIENKMGWPEQMFCTVPASIRYCPWCCLLWPIRGQYPGHVITLDQSEARYCPCLVWTLGSNSLTWLPNVVKVGEPGFGQSEDSIQVSWSPRTNQRPVSSYWPAHSSTMEDIFVADMKSGVQDCQRSGKLKIPTTI